MLHFYIHTTLLLFSILFIDSLKIPDAIGVLGKIISYAIFLSYYIVSGDGAYPTRGLYGSVAMLLYLLLLSCTWNADILYWGKFIGYGVLWAYAFSTYPRQTQYRPIIMVALVLVAANTPGAFMIDWGKIEN